MADKKTPIADNQVGQLAEQMAEKVKESANQIWLAGLGAYSKAEEEGGKLFDSLVQDGEKLEAKTRSIVDKPIVAAKEKVDTVRARATGSWEKVEKAFDHRVSKALHRLNIPTRNDVDELYARVDELNKQIEALSET
ncbi:MAG: phasin family protein, partial [Pseudomonadales bacterium]|nr:phasin family protein [Pseudomonadales bacterium]